MNNKDTNPTMTPSRWEEVSDWLNTLLEQTGDARAATLQEIGQRDPALRRELESLLAADGAALEEFADRLAASASLSGSLSGQRAGNYRLVRELGHGGMGAVYLAERADDAFQKQVAVKLLRHGGGTATRLRFERERQILAQLEHPHIARLLDGGVTEDGTPYLVMEYVAGLPFDQYCAQHGLDARARLELFLAVCGPVEYAHSQGVIHRDLKPGNILVNAAGAPKLLDFGIAKLLTAEPGDPRLTVTGAWLLTPDYASPEQVRGRAVTPASDVYSLGVLLYETLTGARPYQLAQLSPAEIERVICEQEPLPLSVGQAGILFHLAQPGALDRIVRKALAKDPAQRYASVAELSADVRRYLDGQPVQARRPSFSQRAAGFWRRERAALRAAALAALLLLLGVGWTLRARWNLTAAEPIQTVALLPFQSANESDALAQGLATDLINRLNQTGKVVVRPFSATQKYSTPPPDRLAVGRALQVQALLEGRLETTAERLRLQAQLRRVRDGALLWSGQFDERPDQAPALHEALAQQVAAALNLNLAAAERRRLTERHATDSEAYQLYLKGRYLWNKRTAEGLQRSLGFFEQAIARAPRFALAHAGLADVYVVEQNQLPRLEALQKAIAAADRALALDPDLAEAHNVRAFAVWRLNFDWAGAEQGFKRALALNPSYPTAHQWYGLLLMMQGRFAEAEAQLLAAQQLNPTSIPILQDLGVFYRFKRDYNRAVEIIKKLHAFEPDTVRSWPGGLDLALAGRYEEALAAANKSQPTQFRGGRPLPELGKVYAVMGRQAEMAQIYAELEPQVKGINPRPPDLAGYYAMQNRRDQAFAELERAYTERRFQVFVLKVGTEFDNLRADPRYFDLLRRVGLQ